MSRTWLFTWICLVLVIDTSTAFHLIVDALLFDRRRDAHILPALSGAYLRRNDTYFVKRKGSITVLSRHSDSSWCFSVAGLDLLCSASTELDVDVRSVKTWLFTPPSCPCQASVGWPKEQQILTHRHAQLLKSPARSRCYCKRAGGASTVRRISDIRISKGKLKVPARPPNATQPLTESCPPGMPSRPQPRRVFLGFTVNDETGPLLAHIHEVAPVVDAILWIESLIAFSGLPRNSTLERMRRRLAPYMHKIYPVLLTSNGVEPEKARRDASDQKNDQLLGNAGWRSAEYMYNMAGKTLQFDERFREQFLDSRALAGDDVLIVLDADEVIRREALWQVRHCTVSLPVRFQLRNYVYDLQHYNWQLTRSFSSYFQEADWSFATGISIHQLTDLGIDPRAARMARMARSGIAVPPSYEHYKRLPEVLFKNAGWHMHLFYGAKQIARKRAMGLHYSFNRRPYNHTPSLRAMIFSGRHPMLGDCLSAGLNATSCKANACDEPELQRSSRLMCVFRAREPPESLPHLVRDDPEMGLCLTDRLAGDLDRVCPSDVPDLQWQPDLR
ncbi:unnamed protein product [Symbiodinium sp. CCMP2592]|nr:unnamed protein product [Symbiodinium sp. CCMP2592]